MVGCLTVFATALVALDLPVGALGFSLSEKPVSNLLSENADTISSLKEAAAAIASDAPEDDVFYLRYALTGAEEEEMKSRLEQNVRWRSSDEGRLVCEAAKVAIEKATSGDDWNNDPVRAAAPYASVVNGFITEASIVTTSSRAGDLIYCIRAASIDDTALMSAISVENLAKFFLYTKEVNAAVANQRSIDSDRLVCVCTANDLSGIKIVGGSAEFRKALSAVSRKSNELYPSAIHRHNPPWSGRWIFCLPVIYACFRYLGNLLVRRGQGRSGDWKVVCGCVGDSHRHPVAEL